MKKILLLGGSAQQIIAIKTAKRLGYYTVLCDFLEDNPGQYEADKFYLVSTTDKEAVLDVAQKEHVDGVLAYASDPAAPTAAYVGEKLNLPTNPYKSVEILCNKDKFREFLTTNGFNAPKSVGYSEKEAAMQTKQVFELPVIIKPVDSSGSKGATVLDSWNGLENAIEFAFSFSKSHRIIVENYIEKKHKYLIGGDIFVVDGKVVLWGLMNCHRDSKVNPLVPVGKSYPLDLKKEDQVCVKRTLQEMIRKLGIKFGSVNVEVVIDKSNKVWPIDVGPRAGGNMIPDLLGMIFDTDIVEMAILSSMGEMIDIPLKSKVSSYYYSTHNLHSNEDGIYERIEFSEELEKYIIKKCFYKQRGDRVEYFDNAAKALGIIFMKFEDVETAKQILDKISQLYRVILE